MVHFHSFKCVHKYFVCVCVCKPACDCLASLCAGPDPQHCMVNRNIFPGRRNFPQQPPIAVMVVVMSCSCQTSFRLSSLIHVPAAQHLQLEQMFTPMKTRQTRPARIIAPNGITNSPGPVLCYHYDTCGLWNADPQGQQRWPSSCAFLI